ncbi:MAG: hypothetical protein HC770_03760 [Pseudanabaena sp. CRU_2_10]|nr:hypothetical protein [Pseudanabaena sp. CRU_2_10]
MPIGLSPYFTIDSNVITQLTYLIANIEWRNSINSLISRSRKSRCSTNFYRQIEIEDDVSYVLLRMRQTHDIWHIVAGFTADVIGELGLKAFELAQTHRTMAAVLLAGGLLSTLFKSPENLDRLLDRIAVGYRMGTKTKPFLAQKWEDDWRKPLAAWRDELGVEIMPTYIA